MGSVAADIFGWMVVDGFRWFWVVSDGFGWFVILVATFFSQPKSNVHKTFI